MKPVIGMMLLLGAMISVTAIVGLSTAAQAAGKSRDAALLAIMEPVHVTDFSARRKYRRTSSFPFAIATPGSYTYRANPNYGPGTAQFRQARRQHRCVMDEGYGRWTACSNN